MSAASSRVSGSLARRAASADTSASPAAFEITDGRSVCGFAAAVWLRRLHASSNSRTTTLRTPAPIARAGPMLELPHVHRSQRAGLRRQARGAENFAGHPDGRGDARRSHLADFSPSRYRARARRAARYEIHAARFLRLPVDARHLDGNSVG